MEKRCIECEKCFTCEKGVVGRPPVTQQTQRMPTQRMASQGQQSKFFVNSLTVFPTNLCNLRCEYCFVYRYERNFGKNMTMTLDTAKRMLIWLAIMSKNSTPGIHWFGGEPLVAYDIMKDSTVWAEKFFKGTGKKFKWGMTSNMTLIDDEVNEFLKKYDYGVLASIDGLAIDHDKHRVYEGRKPSWNDVISGLDRILTWKDPKRVTVRWTIGTDTGKSIVSGTKYFVEEKNIRHIAHEYVYEDKWSRKDILNVEKKFYDVSDYVADKFIDENIKIDIKTIRDGLRVFFNRRMPDRCGLAKGDFGVDVDGNLFTCHRFVDQYDWYIGNIYKGVDMKKVQELNIWNQEKIVSEDGMERCLTCMFRNGCNAGCIAVNFDTTKDKYVPPRSWCDLQLMKCRVALRFKDKLEKANKWGDWNKKQKRGRDC